MPNLNEERRLPVESEGDIITARQIGREMASQLGFSVSDLTLIATAISEIARNIVDHAEKGEMFVVICEKSASKGICITARDDGPGIDDLDQAMEDGWTSKNGLGLGLPGSRRIMDEFEIKTRKGKGTTVIMKKWKR